MRILLVEDDAVLANGLQKALEQSNFSVDQTSSGEEADYLLSCSAYDVVILDLGLPHLDGLEVLKRLRSRNNSALVMILTARDTLEDRVKGLDIGADDYLTKPFKLPELEARLRALIRRRYFTTNSEIVMGALRFDTSGRRVYVNDLPLELSARELDILEVLLTNMGQVVSKRKFVEHLCNWNDHITMNAVEVYVSRLRRKLEPYNFTFKTVRGIGYMLEKIS